MAKYNDVYGWQNKQFLGRGEFTLDFGDYDVRITVPADHIVAATGELQNSMEVLTKTQIDRMKQAKSSKEPVIIITQNEAEKNEKSRSKQVKTWRFKAKDVRTLLLQALENSFGMLWALSSEIVLLWQCHTIQKRLIHYMKDILLEL